jgi:hypothetical protein
VDDRIFEGEHYEVAIRGQPATDAELATAVAAIRARNDVVMETDARGRARLSDGREVPCVLVATNGERPLMDFSIPIAALDEAYGTEAADDPWADSDWSDAIDEFLIDIVRTVHSRVPIEFAVMGRELFVAGSNADPESPRGYTTVTADAASRLSVRPRLDSPDTF